MGCSEFQPSLEMGRAILEDKMSNNDKINQYDDMLDSTYSFDGVGGIFANMKPSAVLQTCDINAYNSGFSAWLNSEDN